MPVLPTTSTPTLRQQFVPTLRLALPLVFAELGWMSMGVVDTIMVGRLPNSAVAIGATPFSSKQEVSHGTTIPSG